MPDGGNVPPAHVVLPQGLLTDIDRRSTRRLPTLPDSRKRRRQHRKSASYQLIRDNVCATPDSWDDTIADRIFPAK
jgi:hypothetical protein